MDYGDVSKDLSVEIVHAEKKLESVQHKLDQLLKDPQGSKKEHEKLMGKAGKLQEKIEKLIDGRNKAFELHAQHVTYLLNNYLGVHPYGCRML